MVDAESCTVLVTYQGHHKMSTALYRSNDCNIPIEPDAADNQNIFGENRICISFLGCRAFVKRHRCQGSNDNKQGLSGKAFAGQLNTQRVKTKNSARHNKLKIIWMKHDNGIIYIRNDRT